MINRAKTNGTLGVRHMMLHKDLELRHKDVHAQLLKSLLLKKDDPKNCYSIKSSDEERICSNLTEIYTSLNTRAV